MYRTIQKQENTSWSHRDALYSIHTCPVFKTGLQNIGNSEDTGETLVFRWHWQPPCPGDGRPQPPGNSSSQPFAAQSPARFSAKRENSLIAEMLNMLKPSCVTQEFYFFLKILSRKCWWIKMLLKAQKKLHLHLLLLSLSHKRNRSPYYKS